MCKRLTVWIALVAVLSLLGGARAELVGHWALDDGAGTTAVDSSGNGNDGTFQGAPAWVAGHLGGAIRVGGSDWVDCGDGGGALDFGGAITITCWINPTALGGQQGLAARSGAYAFKASDTFARFTTPGVLDHTSVNLTLVNGEWQHLAASFQASQTEGLIFYLNGDETDRIDSAGINAATGPFLIASNQWGENLNGMIDDVRVYDHILTPEEVAEAMLGGEPGMAVSPSPGDGAIDVSRDVVMEWTAGKYAATHDVYFGTVFDDVNDASRSNLLGVFLSQDQVGTSYDPVGTLDFGQTYYWRVDEVNGPTDYTIYKGEVWSFTTEPMAYAVQNVTATSNTVSAPSQGLEHLVDGSGLNAADQHSNNTNHMWAATPNPDGPSYIQFEFDRVYKLHEMLVWNYNMEFEVLLGFGVKEATVEYSDNGTDWDVLGDVVLNRAPGSAAYSYGTVVPFDGVAAQYVRLTIGSSWSPSATMHGLSEVRFMYIPSYAREPQPADAAADVAVDTVLSWRAGRGAASHEVYLSTDPNALVLAGTTTQTSYGQADLQLDTTYYWQVVEVDAEMGAWAGDVWSFSTEPYVEIDGFETYDDEIDAGTTIWQTWLDSYEDAGNGGSFVGNDPSPFAELTIVHSGSQSMPLYYDNANASAFSETDRVFASPQDWTASGIKSLSFWFRGVEGNTGRLYVKINDVKVVYDGAAEDIATVLWLPWNIDLSTVNGLGSVTRMSIGIEGAGSGVMYIDDVRLYPKTPVYGVPTQPGTSNLTAWYKLDGNAADSSGNGFNGVENGGPTYVAGFLGQAVSLDGSDDYISIAGVGVDPCTPRTMAGWVKASSTAAVSGWTDVFGFTGPSVTFGHFDIQCVLDTDYTTLGYYGLHRYGWERDIIPIDLEWHHLAASYDGAIVAWYGDGQCLGIFEAEPAEVIPPGQFHIGKREDNANFFRGLVDEVRVYDLALTPGEVASLAGRTTTTQVPF